MMPALHQDLHAARRRKLIELLIKLIAREHIMIAIFFRAIKRTELAVNVADVRVVNVCDRQCRSRSGIRACRNFLPLPARVARSPARPALPAANAIIRARHWAKCARPREPFPSTHLDLVKPSRLFYMMRRFIARRSFLMVKSVAIVGAGVSGLTCAIVFAERGYRTAIFAEETGYRTTSAAAAAIWFPYDAKPADAVIAWALKTHKRARRPCSRSGDRRVDDRAAPFRARAKFKFQIGPSRWVRSDFSLLSFLSGVEESLTVSLKEFPSFQQAVSHSPFH